MGSAFIARKLGGALLTLAAIAVLNFFLFRMLPGDPVNSLLPRNVSQAQKQSLRLRLGLDQPVFPGVIRAPSGGLSIDLTTLPDSLLENQFLTSMGNLLVLDLGMSFAERKPVDGCHRGPPVADGAARRHRGGGVPDRGHLDRHPRRLATWVTL